jgi:hypothetical protein
MKWVSGRARGSPRSRRSRASGLSPRCRTPPGRLGGIEERNLARRLAKALGWRTSVPTPIEYMNSTASRSTTIRLPPTAVARELGFDLVHASHIQWPRETERAHSAFRLALARLYVSAPRGRFQSGQAYPPVHARVARIVMEEAVEGLLAAYLPAIAPERPPRSRLMTAPLPSAERRTCC